MQEIVELLLEDSRVDPSIHHNTAVRFASKKGFVGIVRILLNDARVNPSDLDNAALIHAVDSGNIEIVRMLLKYGSFIF
jgi:ankyrin repeat protein